MLNTRAASSNTGKIPGLGIDPGYDRVFTSQKVFRVLLDAQARPGTVMQLPDIMLQLDEIWPAGLGLIGLTFLDPMTSFTVHGDGADRLVSYLQRNTSCPTEPLAAAEWLFARATAPEIPALLEQVNPGTLAQPDAGATVVLAVEHLVEGNAAAGMGTPTVELRLRGPGIKEEAVLTVAGLTRRVVDSRNLATSSFPLGIDLILVDRAARVAAIPRTTKAICKEVG